MRRFGRSNTIRSPTGDLHPLLKIELKEIRARFVAELQRTFTENPPPTGAPTLAERKNLIPRSWTFALVEIPTRLGDIPPLHVKTEYLGLRNSNYRRNADTRKLQGFMVGPVEHHRRGPSLIIRKALADNPLMNMKILARTQGVLGKRLFDHAESLGLGRDLTYVTSYNVLTTTFQSLRGQVTSVTSQEWEAERDRMRQALPMPPSPNLAAMPLGTNSCPDTFFWVQASMYKNLGWRSGCAPGPRNPVEDGLPPVMTLNTPMDAPGEPPMPTAMPTSAPPPEGRTHDDRIFRGIFSGSGSGKHLSKKRRDRQKKAAEDKPEAPAQENQMEVDQGDPSASASSSSPWAGTLMGLTCPRCGAAQRRLAGLGPFCTPGCPENCD